MNSRIELNDDFVAAIAEAPESCLSSIGRPSSRIVHVLLTTAMFACFALAGWTAFQSPALNAAPSHSVGGASVSQKALSTTSIEDLRLGQRVVGRNPLREQTQSPSDISPQDWREVRLTMDAHGATYDLAFLRPLDWLKAVGAAPGSTIHMELPEMRLVGPALVEAILDCPPIEPDDGTGRMLVTGTMRHLAGNILDVSITGLDEPLGVTDTHPLWSETRQDFVVAGQLEVGEHLRSETGTLAQVTRITPRRGPPELTYNLEVDGEHVYQVGATGLVVHNDCSFVSQMSPDEAARYQRYWQGDMPAQITPGISNNVRQQLASNGDYVYDAVGHYDEFGRLIGRTDLTTHPSTGLLHSNPHYHLRNELFGDKTAEGFKTGNTAEWLKGHLPGFFGID